MRNQSLTSFMLRWIVVVAVIFVFPFVAFKGQRAMATITFIAAFAVSFGFLELGRMIGLKDTLLVAPILGPFLLVV